MFVRFLKYFFLIYKKHFSFVAKYKWKFLVSFAASILLLFLLNYAYFAIGSIIDSVNANDAQNVLGAIVKIAIILSLPIIVEPITFHFRSRVFSSVVKDLTAKVYGNVMSLDYSYHTDKETGKLVSKIINTGDVVTMFIWSLDWFTIENLASLLIPLVLISTISSKIALAIFLIIIASLPLFTFALRFNIKRRKILKEADYKRNSIIVDGIGNYETVKSFGRKDEEQHLLDESLLVCESTVNKYQDTFRLIDFVTRLVGIILFACGGYMVYIDFKSGMSSLGESVVVLTYLIQISNRVMGLIFSFREVLKNLPIAEDLYDLLDLKSKITEPPNPVSLSDPEGLIIFDQVEFSYDKKKKVLDKLSLTINPNQNIALVGPSGGGKSTIVKLLMRYYDVDAGSVKIDGIDVRSIATSDLSNVFGLVPQEPVLFNRSILFNVGYSLSSKEGVLRESLSQIEDACEKAQIRDFIRSLPDGYDTVVGERGIKLSGGQKQRLAIARVILKDPEIIIFDEATSMLDSESELAIQKAFTELSKNKTTIIIAHRLSTIIHCDNIFVIDEGQLKESGTHAQLLKKKGIYATLWIIQSGGFKKKLTLNGVNNVKKEFIN